MSTQDFTSQADNGKQSQTDNLKSFLDKLYDAIGQQAERLQAIEDSTLDKLYGLVETLRDVAQRAQDGRR